MASPIYTGFSTVNGYQTLYNIDIVNQDLLNNFYTRRGERPMDPNYGSIIPDLLFENKSATIVSTIQNDITNIIANDPRVQLQTMEIAEQENGYVIFLSLYYIHTKTIGALRVEFNNSIGIVNQQ